MDKKNDAVTYLRKATTIRSCCREILTLARADKLQHWQVNESAWDSVCAYVFQEIQENYPDFNIPRHSRLRHIDCGGINRWQDLANQVGAAGEAGLWENIFVSVLLDAGAGMAWRFRESKTGQTHSRSEGLAIACHEMFINGFFSSNSKSDPFRIDAKRLLALTLDELKSAFQVTEKNPLLGATGRLELLKRLGELMGKDKRLADLLIPIFSNATIQNKTVDISKVFEQILSVFSPIWPDGLIFEGVNIGDVGLHSQIKNGLCPGFVPFHKLSQWLVYSLADALESRGYHIQGLSTLTGLPEYRNGGLFFDLDLLRPKDLQELTAAHPIQSEWVVEWRALTLALLDELSQKLLTRHPKELSGLELAQILQGGTWSAGRKIAKTRRSDGGPPFNIVSNGTLF